MHTLGVQVRGRVRSRESVHDFRTSSESDGVIDERRDLSIETRTRLSSWWECLFPEVRTLHQLLPSFSRTAHDFFGPLRIRCFYFELLLPAKARLDKVLRSVAAGPVDPAELPRNPRSSRAFLRRTGSLDEWIDPGNDNSKREVSESATVVGKEERGSVL